MSDEPSQVSESDAIARTVEHDIDGARSGRGDLRHAGDDLFAEW